jgi:hypothetical protein
MRLLHNLGKLRASRKYASQLSPGLEQNLTMANSTSLFLSLFLHSQN